ncbi:hypothetical protein RJZ56_002820 [Blastomyces dermatitidis]|uniref:Might be a transmembrane protein n=2 Tax=Ajellomyces dermatitidis TaxID=5039 RepID=F2TNF4_AJEDA|nr:uncharacterized protein BDCG_09444 [Blastomyces dermatitidis ER-3]EEQ86175.1 hypothetical protein BDCG_09444 [Blastomyces dermatitidis ER-3]EGE84767.1 might be a transmembrane protein [Blastomyces dermatitidis ATCC 18188]EQL30576.1 hypothetical protein BDFG_06968 [Blastomyces dermatitidis ATCC 26199]KMW68445.1 might be a transmembrane protein, variant [Blastomyces dermatitidis ATCC 18188]
MTLVNTALRGALFATRLLQWCSAVIVMGIVAYFLNKGPKGGHLKYEIVIAVLSVAFFIPGLLSPFIPVIGSFAFPIDIIFSYLWLTSFIFTAQDYNKNDCAFNAPPGGRCSLKYALEAFTFLAFFGCLAAAMLEIYNLWTYHKNRSPATHPTKEVPRQSAETGGTAGTV